MPKVNIIVSTYNGEKYISQQIDSLLGQDYPDVEIYVRDDGSTDGTLDILRQYEEKGKIKLIVGSENLGYCGSFFELLKIAENGEYWSFCDQDDIWYKEKVKRAVEFLETKKGENRKPLLYYSFSKMIDENGRSMGIQKPPEGTLEFRRAFTGTFGVGFSMVINRELRDAMLKCDPHKVHAHDWLAGAIALGMGEVLIDPTVCADYRRLDSSVTRISFGRKVKWLVSMLTDQGDVKERNMEFSRCFYDSLSDENKKIVKLFDNEKYSLGHSLVKAFYPRRWRPSLSSEVVMRGLMILGKV